MSNLRCPRLPGDTFGQGSAPLDDNPRRARPTCSSRSHDTRVRTAGEPEDEAAVKAEAMAIVAQAKKDIKLREEARGEMKKASTKDDIQALINKRLAQSFADRPKQPEKPKEAPKPVKEAPKEALEEFKAAWKALCELDPDKVPITRNYSFDKLLFRN